MTQPHSHIVKSHDEERNRVISEILRMGSMAAAQLEAALDVLERRDDKAAERIIGNDEEIDKLEREISQDAMTLRSEEHTSELQSLMRKSYAVFCLKTQHLTRQTTIETTNKQ